MPRIERTKKTPAIVKGPDHWSMVKSGFYHIDWPGSTMNVVDMDGIRVFPI